MANKHTDNTPKGNPIAPIIQILALESAPDYIKQTEEFRNKAEQCSLDIKNMLLRGTKH